MVRISRARSATRGESSDTPGPERQDTHGYRCRLVPSAHACGLAVCPNIAGVRDSEPLQERIEQPFLCLAEVVCDSRLRDTEVVGEFDAGYLAGGLEEAALVGGP